MGKLIKFLKMPFRSKKELFFRRIWYKFNNLIYGRFERGSLIEKTTLITNHKNIFIGKNVSIKVGTRIEPIKLWKNNKFEPQIIINDNVSIQQNCHITAAKILEIGRDVTLAADVMITDIDHEYRDINKGILEQPLIVNETIIGEQTYIGMGARIMAGTKLGKHCVVGANSVVKGTFPDYCVIVGLPAKIVKKYNFEKQKWEKVENDI